MPSELSDCVSLGEVAPDVDRLLVVFLLGEGADLSEGLTELSGLLSCCDRLFDLGSNGSDSRLDLDAMTPVILNFANNIDA